MNNLLLAVTTYNQADYTDRCLATLKGLSAKVVCFDDASADDTPKICAKHGVELITRKERKGLTYSWNLAYQYFIERDYDFLIISNNDILFPNGCIENMVKVLRTFPLVSAMSRKNEGGCWADRFAVEAHHGLESTMVDDPANFQKVQDLVGETVQKYKEISPFSGYCFGVNRKIAECEFSPGVLFDPADINTRQEKDLMERCRESVLCLNAFVYHFKGMSFKKRLIYKLWDRSKGRTVFDDRDDLRIYR